MNAKILVLLAVLLFAAPAFAVDPMVEAYADANNLYPSRTNTINMLIGDKDGPADFNIEVYYMLTDYSGRTEITSATGTAGVNDRNGGTYCSDGIGDTNLLCTLTWTLPTGLDNNYLIDVNVWDNVTADDLNFVTETVYIDSNACDTDYSINNDEVTLIRVCTGLGTDNNIGTETTYYEKSRQGGCGTNYSTYSTPFTLSFGEFTVCYYSTDGLGNTEDQKSFVHEADSDAYAIALLTEIALASLVLMLILGAFIFKGVELNKEIMIALTVAAVIVAIAIVIFGTVL